MELFMDGGLRDEGGTTDPVSGNDVPVGSTQEEVRDDIPAQLSEGEFVLPADVVRYHGLEKIMELRDEAKAGLQRMEAMGQMGNSEEAIIPDGVPFDIDDLETEDDGREYQVGGYVAPPSPFGVNYQQGVAGPQQYTSQFAGYAQQPATQPAVVAPPPPPPPTQQFTPISTKTAPDFGTFVTPKYVTYVDANGNTIQIPVDENGNPLIPVPAGYSPQGQTASTPTTPDAAAGTGTGAPQTFTSEGGDSGPSVSTSQDSGSGLSTSESDIAAFKLLENAQGLLGSSYGEQVKGIQDKYKFNPLSPLTSIIGEFKERSEIKAAREEQIKNLADAAGLSVEDTTNVLSTLSDEIKSGYRAADTGVVKKKKTIGEPSTRTIDDIDEFGNIAPDGSMPITDIRETATKVEDITKTAQDNQAQADAAAGVGVESAQVRQAGTTATEAVEKITETPDELNSRVDKIVDYMNSITKGDVSVVSKERGGNVVVEGPDALGTGKVTSVITPQGDVIRQYEGSDELKEDPYKRADLAMPSAGRDSGVPDFVKSTPSRVSTRSTSTGRPDIPSLTASERADMEAAEDEGGSAFDDYGKAFDRNYDNARNRGYSDSGAREYAANKTDADREAQEQTGSSYATAVTSSDGTPVRSGSDNSIVTNDYKAAEQQDSEPSGGCVIATHGVSTGGFSLRDKAKAEIWCEKTYHGKWYGEAFRRGYRYYANRAVQKGVAHEYYSEFKNFVACGRGLKTDVKSKLNYYRRTIQFFVTGLFVQ